jgi:hypoxanthine-DNA glycosylase
LRKKSFPPVVDENTRLLVLGSLPGEVSLAQSRYYAHPRNTFWLLMGEVVGEDLVSLDYEARLAALKRHNVGLWDVVAEASRKGSLDADIRDIAGNDLAGLIATLPKLEVIAFNGAASAKIGSAQLGALADRLRLIALPSSSPAYAGRMEMKLEAWRALRPFVSRP